MISDQSDVRRLYRSEEPDTGIATIPWMLPPVPKRFALSATTTKKSPEDSADSGCRANVDTSLNICTEYQERARACWMLCRRGLDMKVIAGIRAAFLAVGISCGTVPSSAVAVEPATITAAVTVVSAVAGLLSPRKGAGLDPASQAYFEQLLRNQELLTNQMAEIADQLKVISETVERISDDTVELHKQIGAGSVYAQAMALELKVLENSLVSGPFDAQDRSLFNDMLNDIRTSASDHTVLVKRISQSVEMIVSVHLLAISLEAMLNVARNAEFTTSGDKRHFRIVLEFLHEAAVEFKQGKDSPKWGTFVGHRTNSKTAVDTAIVEMIAFGAVKDEGAAYRIAAPERFFREATPSEWNSPRVDNRRQVGATEYCLKQLHIERCLSRYSSGSQTFYLGSFIPESRITKRYIEDEAVSGHFVLEIMPYFENSQFVRAMEDFNEAKIQTRIYDAAAMIVDRMLDQVRSMLQQIEEM